MRHFKYFEVSFLSIFTVIPTTSRRNTVVYGVKSRWWETFVFNAKYSTGFRVCWSKTKGGSRATMKICNALTFNHCRMSNSTNSIFIFGVSSFGMAVLRISICLYCYLCWKSTLNFTDDTADVGSRTILKNCKIAKV